jgi:hypothetical protein
MLEIISKLLNPPEFKITIPIPLSTLNDFIITAIEGGSNYWYLFGEEATKQIEKYMGVCVPEIHGQLTADFLADKAIKPDVKNAGTTFYGTFSEAVLVAVISGEAIKVHDVLDVAGPPVGILSIESIERGFNKMVEDKRPELYKLLDGEDYDANDADVVFQYITLGEIVYG